VNALFPKSATMKYFVTVIEHLTFHLRGSPLAEPSPPTELIKPLRYAGFRF